MLDARHADPRKKPSTIEQKYTVNTVVHARTRTDDIHTLKNRKDLSEENLKDNKVGGARASRPIRNLRNATRIPLMLLYDKSRCSVGISSSQPVR
jgi:hypothetical protein